MIKMFLGDYHTHTVHSHGKSTMEQNIVKAISLGLKEIATTDHGFKHMAYNVRRSDFNNIIKEKQELSKKYPQIMIYLGIESNLQSMCGDIDVENGDLALLDIVVAGYHKFVKPSNWKDIFGFYLSNMLWQVRSTKKLISKNTDAFIKAIEKYPIDIISHPQAGINIDVLELAKACEYYKVYFELNGKRILTTDSEFLLILEKTNVEFVADSDAHTLDRIGDFSLPLKVIKSANIPYSRIANWNRLPSFRSRKNRSLTVVR